MTLTEQEKLTMWLEIEFESLARRLLSRGLSIDALITLVEETADEDDEECQP